MAISQWLSLGVQISMMSISGLATTSRQSVEAFLQESGRGGRDGKPAYSVVLMKEVCSRPQRKGSAEPDGENSRRKRKLMEILQDRETCVREGLLRAMGSESEFCSGCDVCANSRPRLPQGKREILHFFWYSRYRYGMGTAVRILHGHLGTTAPIDMYRGIFGFGLLKSWTESEIQEAMGEMILGGFLKKPRRGPWRGLIGTPLKLFRRGKIIGAGPDSSARGCKPVGAHAGARTGQS